MHSITLTKSIQQSNGRQEPSKRLLTMGQESDLQSQTSCTTERLVQQWLLEVNPFHKRYSLHSVTLHRPSSADCLETHLVYLHASQHELPSLTLLNCLTTTFQWASVTCC